MNSVHICAVITREANKTKGTYDRKSPWLRNDLDENAAWGMSTDSG